MSAKTRLLSLFLLVASAVYAADVSGIWTGEVPGRHGEKGDVSFQFKANGEKLTGKLFGDEFDLAVEQGTISGDQIKFIITTKNYYSGNQTQFRYEGQLTGDRLELTRERVLGPGEKLPEGDPGKQVIKLTRITS